MSLLSWPFVIKSICAAIIFFCTMVTIYTLGPLAETRFFPVVGKLQILRMDPLPGKKTAVFAAFEKLRNCEYIGIAWFSGSRQKGFERVPLVLYRQPGDDSSPNRPIGFQRAGPWEIALTAEEVRTRSFAELHHRCHPLWATVTEFYP